MIGTVFSYNVHSRKAGIILTGHGLRLLIVFPKGAQLVRFRDLDGTPKEDKKKNDPDYTAGALLAFVAGNIYIIDIQARSCTPGEIEKLIQHTAALDDSGMYGGKVLQIWEEEGGAGGKHITEYYQKMLNGHLRKPYRIGKNKEFYIDLMANKAETGNVYCVAGKWLYEQLDNNTFFDEAEEFPKGRHDDRIDAASKACHYLTEGIVEIGDVISAGREKPAWSQNF